MKTVAFCKYWCVGSIVSLLVAGCGGGGGGDSETPVAVSAAPTTTAPTTTEPTTTAPTAATGNVDLADAATALKVTSALLGVTQSNRDFFTVPWDTLLYQGASRTESDVCRTIVFSNPDATVSNGDSMAAQWAACIRNFPGGTITQSRNETITLDSISNPAAPQSAAWTARESWQQNKSSKWDITAASSYRFEGNSDSTTSWVADISHVPDGNQTETWGVRTSSKGTENGAGFEYLVDGQFVCNFVPGAANLQASACSVVKATLKGQIGGKSLDAVLTQPKVSQAPNELTYQVEQAGQKVSVVFAFGSGPPRVTMVDGRVLSVNAANLIFIGGGY